jgi:small ligand-binding sensory domain FIST
MGVARGRFGAALSEHPVLAYAVGETTGALLEQVGEEPDLALLFVTPPHAGALEDAAATVAELLRPRALLGCAAESVLGTGREVEGTPAVSLWAGRVGPVALVELEGREAPPVGWPAKVGFDPELLVLLADPFSFGIESFLEWLGAAHPRLPVVGGMASAARGPGGNRLVAGSRVRTDGAVGALLGASAPVDTVVSQGCRPIGHPLVVTRSEGTVVAELAGRPALERLLELAESGVLSERDLLLVNRGGLHLGRVIDERKEHFGAGDFLVRNVVGADRSSGAIAVNDVVDVGTTVQYQLRDADAADADLRALLAGRSAEAALVFTCNGRGTRLFGERDHDAGVLCELLGPIPAAGMFAAGELGPVGGRNFLHGFTASIALFGAAAAEPPAASRGEARRRDRSAR